MVASKCRGADMKDGAMCKSAMSRLDSCCCRQVGSKRAVTIVHKCEQ
jgi:hypothetical protein